jgi:hypothetical protein
MYVKYKSYPLKKEGIPFAFVMIKVHFIKMKLKANITMQDGREFELYNQWSTDEEFDKEIQRFVNEKIFTS